MSPRHLGICPDVRCSRLRRGCAVLVASTDGLGSDMAEIERIPARPKDLGELRTVMAADRTLMAWIRTALSMFSFGFTIYKVLESMADAGTIQNSQSPQTVGLVLAAMGVGSILLVTIGYWLTLRDLEQAGKFRLGRPVLLMAAFMSVIGVLLFAGIATRAI